MALSNVPQWVAAYTAPRQEKKVTSRIIKELGIEAYVPLHSVLRQWSDRVKRVEIPLIPSYTFIKMTEGDFWQLRNIVGLCGYVTFPGTGIATIPEQEIMDLKRLADSKADIVVRNTAALQFGAKVRVIGGPFEGMVGMIVKDSRDGNFSVQVSGLNLSLIIVVEKDALLYIGR